jgi:sigma-B regulation protein RsbU (phosphoserine phosphatase)
MATDPHSSTRFRDRTELLDFLLEVSQITSETLDLDRLMEQVAAIIQEVVSYDLFAILLYTEKLRGLRVRYAIGHRAEIVGKLLIPLSEGLTGAAASTLQPVLVGDVRNDPRYLPTVDAVRTELAVPMVARGRLVGIIDLQSTKLNAYSDGDSALVRLIASRVAASIDNARLHRRIVRQNHSLRTLATLAHSFSSTLDLDELLNRIATTVRKIINYDAFSVLLLDADRGLLRSRFSLRYDQRVELDNIPIGKGITGMAAESKQVIRVEDTRGDTRYIESTPGIRSEVAVPLMVRDRVLGVMDLESRRVSYFTDDHVQMLSLLAPLVSNSIENARLYEDIASRERRSAENLRAARHLQEALLLRPPPPIEGLEVAVRSRPAQEISGDLYDFFEQDNRRCVIAFGDVSGKGAAAALYGALLNGLLRILATRHRSPSSLLSSLNESLSERKVHATYVTLLILYWEPWQRRLRMTNAGVFPPIICRGGGILKQRVEGVPLGLLDDTEYDEVVFEAQPGDTILLYSDGVHDQENAAGQEYGRGRLYSVLERCAGRPPSGVADAVFEDLDRFAAGAAAEDDQTVIVLRVQ